MNRSVKRVATVKTLVRFLLSIVIGLLVSAGSSEGFFHKKKAAAIPEDDFKKLGIEKPEKAFRAPDFTLEDLTGRRLGPRDFMGKVAFLNFWATWCVPCRQEMPTMEKLHRELKKQGLEVVAINFREAKKEVRGFASELGLTFTVLLDKEGKVSEEYGAWALPLSYFIDRQGVFVGKVSGYRKWDSREGGEFFRRLLGEKN